MLNRKENETLISYFKRITLNKKEMDLDYCEWGELILGEKVYSSENLRKSFYTLEKMFKRLDDEQLNELENNKSESNLFDELKEAIGDLDIKKMEVRSKTNRLNKIKRDFVKSIEISNDLKETIHNEIGNFPQFDFKPIISESENKLIVTVSDFHIGYVIKDYKGNSYNFEIAKKRLSVYICEIKKVCELYNVTDIVVVNLGDSVENTGMRVNQAFEVEYDLSHQIVKATQLLYSFITDISVFANVEFYSVGGNHNRMAGMKDANLEGDNSNVIIVEMIKDFVEISKNNRITIGYTDYKDDSCVFDVNGFKCKAIHGDNRVSGAKKLFDGESTMDKEDYNLILRGHFHNFNVQSQNDGYVITSGCLFGYNPYSVKKMSCSTNASQAMVLISDKVEFIKDVNLQII